MKRILELSIEIAKSNKKLIFWSTASIFISFYILLTLQTVTSGSKFASLEKEEANLDKQNHELSARIMQSTSLLQLEQKSEALGFVKPNETLYVVGKTDTVADLPRQ